MPDNHCCCGCPCESVASYQVQVSAFSEDVHSDNDCGGAPYPKFIDCDLTALNGTYLLTNPGGRECFWNAGRTTSCLSAAQNNPAYEQFGLGLQLVTFVDGTCQWQLSGIARAQSTYIFAVLCLLFHYRAWTIATERIPCDNIDCSTPGAFTDLLSDTGAPGAGGIPADPFGLAVI